MSARAKAGAAAALLAAGASVAWPPLALPALLAVVVATIVLPGRARVVVAVAGGLLAFTGIARFAAGTMAPNLVGSGGRAAEKEALSHLREVLWAQDLVRQAPPSGLGAYAPLGALAGGDGRAPLQADLYRPLPVVAGRPAVFARGGYLFAVWLPARGGGWAAPGVGEIDPAGAARAWRGFAWPAVLREGSRRAYFIDQDDRICETANPLGYQGVEKMPAPDALPDGSSCEPDRDGSGWRAWRNKKPRPPRAAQP